MCSTHTLEYYQITSVIQWCASRVKQYILYRIDLPQVDMIIDNANYQLKYSNTLAARGSKYQAHLDHMVRRNRRTPYHVNDEIRSNSLSSLVVFKTLIPKQLNQQILYFVIDIMSCYPTS